jgi:predicted ATPase
MRLKTVTIKHFKSLSNVQIALDPLTVLAGRNAAGKSNLVDALRFLRDIAAHGLDDALVKRGGIALARQHSKSKPFDIEIAVTFCGDEGAATELGSYSIIIASLRNGRFKIKQERAVVAVPHVPRAMGSKLPWPGARQMVRVERDASGRVKEDGRLDDKHPMPEDATLLGGFRSHPLGYLGNYLASFQFASIHPNAMRGLSRPDLEQRRVLREDGANWASVLRNMRRSRDGQRAYERIMQVMRLVMPSLTEVSVHSAGGYFVPKFKVREKLRGMAQDFDLDTEQLSDGTLRIFGLLMAVYQPRRPSLIVIEEPEQTVHPGLLAALAESFREVSPVSQVLLTSHSPHFVELFQPEAVRVIHFDNGQTRAGPLKRSQADAVSGHLMGLGEFMAAEGLELEP